LWIARATKDSAGTWSVVSELIGGLKDQFCVNFGEGNADRSSSPLAQTWLSSRSGFTLQPCPCAPCLYPKRFSRPDIQLAQQINVGSNSPGELIVDEKLLEQLTAGYRELHPGSGAAS
jgi:hypothetical protein